MNLLLEQFMNVLLSKIKREKELFFSEVDSTASDCEKGYENSSRT